MHLKLLDGDFIVVGVLGKAGCNLALLARDQSLRRAGLLVVLHLGHLWFEFQGCRALLYRRVRAKPLRAPV